MAIKWLSAPPPVLWRGVGGFGGGGGGSGGGTYGLIVNRLALHRNRRTPRGGRLTYSVGTGRRRDRGGWRRRTAAAAAARGGRRGWRRFTMTYRPTISVARAHYTTTNKAMETTKVVKTRTVKARVKARSGVCEWVDCCCCCCFRSSWDRWTRRSKWPLSPLHRRRRAAAVVPHEVPVQPDCSRPERWCQRPYDLLSPHPRAISKLKHPAANTAGSSSMLAYIYAFRRRGSVLPIPRSKNRTGGRVPR